jgi:hypothetical protein
MTIAEQIADLHAAHPEWTASIIASTLGVSSAVVRNAVNRRRLALPSEHLLRARTRMAIGGPRKFRKIGYAGKEHPSSSEWGR